MDGTPRPRVGRETLRPFLLGRSVCRGAERVGQTAGRGGPVGRQRQCGPAGAGTHLRPSHYSSVRDRMNNTRIVIEAGRTAAQYWRDLWRYRELLYFLAWRDIAIHYKQTVMGAAWALVRPLSTVLVFVLVFNKVAHLQSPVEGLPYFLFVLAAMLPWQLFASSLSQVSNSLVANSNLVSKVYFPRLVLP